MNKENIKQAWEYSMLANTDEQTVLEKYPDALLLGDSQKGDFGYCVARGDKVIVAFRGSDDKEDWKSNLKERVNGYGYHTGYWDASHNFIKQIKQFIDDQPDTTKVIFCGHSRGGALAIINNYLIDPYYSSKAVVFGCPKVCTKDSVLYKEDLSGCLNITSVVNSMDIVPRTPFEFPYSKDYVRVGTEIVIGKRLSFLGTMNMMWFAMRGKGEWEWFSDHQPDAYTRSLRDL